MRLEIAVTVAPGKPGATSETISSARNASACRVTVERSEAAEMVSVPLSECVALWKIVVRGDLESFEPREKPGRIFDYGSRRLRLAWQESEGSAWSRHEATWIRPLDNGDDVAELFSALALLAQDRAEGVRLFYLTP